MSSKCASKLAMVSARIVACGLLCSAGFSVSAGTGAKRGLVGSWCSHIKLFSPAAQNWMYNYGVNFTQWGHNDWETPECQAIAARPGFEYVPMVSTLSKLDSVGNSTETHAKHLLGMNEPSNAKKEPADLAAKRWKEYEAIADSFEPPLRLGTPAPGGLNLQRGLTWLHDFFSSCQSLHGLQGCRVDFVAVHFYECNGTTDETAEQGAKDMMTFLDTVYSAFQKPVWLTEFNCGDGDPTHNPFANQTAANHLRFMKAALPKLEAAPHVERYSWFQAWQKNTPSHPGANPGCSLANQPGDALTDLGEFYNSYKFDDTHTFAV